MRRRVSIAPLAALAAACTYDWGVGPSPDAGVDATFADAPIVADAPVAIDAPPADAGVDAPPPPPFDCDAAGAALPALLATAKSCSTGPDECMVTLVDPCGCTEVLGAADTPYAASVSAFLEAGCAPEDCPSPCPMAHVGLCLASADGGAGLACAQ